MKFLKRVQVPDEVARLEHLATWFTGSAGRTSGPSRATSKLITSRGIWRRVNRSPECEDPHSALLAQVPP
jgi:hypothetical protein